MTLDIIGHCCYSKLVLEIVDKQQVELLIISKTAADRIPPQLSDVISEFVSNLNAILVHIVLSMRLLYKQSAMFIYGAVH